MFLSLVKVQQKKSAERMFPKTKIWFIIFLFFRLGFKSMTTIEKVCAAFPELDMVNHMNRVKLSEMIKTEGLVRDENFRPIDGKTKKTS